MKLHEREKIYKNIWLDQSIYFTWFPDELGRPFTCDLFRLSLVQSCIDMNIQVCDTGDDVWHVGKFKTETMSLDKAALFTLMWSEHIWTPNE